MKIPLPLISLALLLATGCSVFRSATQTLTVTTVPTNAVLVINGVKYQPPVKIPVRRDRPVIIQCEAPGLEPQLRTIDTHLNGTAFLDFMGLLFFLVPGIGLATPGSHSLEYTAVHLDLFHPYVVETRHWSTGPTNAFVRPTH